MHTHLRIEASQGKLGQLGIHIANLFERGQWCYVPLNKSEVGMTAMLREWTIPFSLVELPPDDAWGLITQYTVTCAECWLSFMVEAGSQNEAISMLEQEDWRLLQQGPVCQECRPSKR